MTTQIGYARVSKADGSQVHDLQHDALVAAGVDPEHIYEDAASGRLDKRPGLDACLKALRRDDTLAFDHEGCRFVAPRSVDELLALRSRHPAATLLAGGTDLGLWVNKGLRPRWCCICAVQMRMNCRGILFTTGV